MDLVKRIKIMPDWKDELNKKEKELNLKKEVINDNTSQGNSSLRDRSDSGRRSNVYRVSVHKETNNKNLTKGGNVMIPAKGIWDDFKAIDADTKLTDYQKLSLKLEKIVKVILNCRTNDVKIMEKLGIPKDEPKKEEKKETK